MINNNLHKNSKNELIDEILKLREKLKKTEEKVQDLEEEITKENSNL